MKPFHFLHATLLLLISPAAAGEAPNPQMKAVLDVLGSLGGKPIETLDAREARTQPTPADAVKALLKKQEKSTAPEPVASVKEQSYTGGKPDAAELPLRIYTPGGKGPFPVVLYFHGGGWVIADLDTYDSTPRALANAAKAVIVPAHYRQAPEKKFPAAHLDALNAYKWVLKHTKELNGIPGQVAVAGESAGGNLAAAVCIQAKQTGMPLPVHQLLVYPVADATDMETESYKDSGDAKPLNKPMMEWFAKQILDAPAQAGDPLLSIAKAGDDLKGMPSATIINASIDPLRSDGEKLEKAFTAAGVKVTRKIYTGVAHEFFGMGAVVDAAKQATEFGGAALSAAFATSRATSGK